MLIHLSIKASRSLFAILALVHLLAAISLLLSSLDWMVKLLIILALIAHWYYSRPKPTGLIYKDKNQWFIKTGDGNWQAADLSPKTLCFRFYVLLVLRLKHPAKLVYLPLLAGDIAAEDFRRLRVLLKFYG